MFKIGYKEYTFKFGDKVDRGDNDLKGVIMRDYIDVPASTEIEIARNGPRYDEAWITKGWTAENLDQYIV